ncbi:flagellar assembly protein FliH [Teredinibacter purpureus]|uniref:flagellar assembly protein FliH n=1 Tax=Teredinibacter purpureus TaxID=2731756 RepID=UPI0005F839DA|nr:flagellar assembly protein FliH [Teredinibacter purpureus]
MTDVSKQVNRIPQEDITVSDRVTAWDLPDVGQHKKVIKSAETEKKAAQKKANSERVETVTRQEKPKPPTAEQLQEMADQAQQEGYADGFKQGMEKGVSQGEVSGLKAGELKAYKETKKRSDDEIARLAAIASQLFDPLQNQDQQLENIIVSMVVSLSKRLLGDEISAAPEKIVTIVNRAVKALPVGASNITVFVNEEDAQLIDASIPPEHRTWDIMNDAALARGGCRIETADSLIDYSVETRLADYFVTLEEEGDTLNVTSENTSARDNTV